MTLQHWFIKNTKTPLAVLGAFVALIFFFFAYYAVRSNQDHQYNNFRDLIVTSVNIGIQQNNRELIESSLSRSVNVLEAKAAYLCKNKQVLISTGFDIQKCAAIPQSNFLNRQLKFNVSGFSDYNLYFIVPKYTLKNSYVWMLIATLFILLASTWIIVRVRQKFIKDILLPMQNNLLTDHDLEIYEFRNLQEKIKELSSSKEKVAFEDAVLESKKAFSHNVKSPLRNLKLIRQKFKDSFNQDDHELFESAINQITNMADKFSTRAFRKNNSSALNKPKLAIFEIEEIINDSIKKKAYEWSDKEISLKMISKLTSQTAAVIEVDEMRALLSNILNNSSEANASNVELMLSSDEGSLFIDIIDNGRGIPTTIRASLFDEGITAGKMGGTGYGLYHAKKYLRLWGGDIELIGSTKGRTHFTIRLPIWKAPQIPIQKIDTVVILDDKLTEIARIKKSVDASRFANNVMSFTNAIEFLSWYTANKQNSIALLADYDLGEDSPNGVELIQSLGLEAQSVLVTDNYEDDQLYSQCKVWGIQLAPKNNIERLSFLT